jgi:hypothetical protein
VSTRCRHGRMPSVLRELLVFVKTLRAVPLRRRDLVLPCAIVLAGLALDSNAATQLRLVSRNGSAKAPHGLAVLRSVPDPQSPSQRTVTREVAFTGDSITIDEAPGSRWDLSLRATGYWAPPVVVTLPPVGQSQQMEIPVWRTTALSGRLRFPEKESAPKVITVAVESPPQPANSAEIVRGTQFDCELAADGAWACTVPATTLDLAIRIKGYAPVYRWSVALAPEHPTDLGDLRPQKGASLIAWLDTGSAKLLKEPASARLTRMIAPESSPTAARLGAPVAEAVFNARGAVQLVSLPAGTYVLTVTAKGFAPARAFPLEVFAGSETALRKPVKLEPPITVRLSVRPPKDPNGAPWLVDLRRVNDFAAGYDIEPAARKQVSATGFVEVPEQAPGSFQATVSDHAGSVFVRRDLDLREPHGEAIVIDVPLVPVRGKVLLGDAAFPSDLWFGQRNASVSVRLTTNDEGAFEGALPHDGLWSVQVAGRSQKLETILPVTVGPDDLVIRVPDTTASGSVVDPAGGPVDRMDVTANASGRIVSLRANPDGGFVFRGLPETTIGFEAHDLRTGRRSKSVETTLKAGEPREGIALRIEPEHQLSGHVLSRGAAVIGARVTAYAFFEGSGSAQQFRAVSNEQGAFDLQVPDAARHAWIIVGAPGKTLQSYDITLTGEPLVLELEPVGGALILAWPKASLPPNVTRAGVPLMLPDLTAWARPQGETLQGSRLRVPNVAPGPYRACSPVRGAPDAKLQMRCTEGVLAPGGTLTLDLGS